MPKHERTKVREHKYYTTIDKVAQKSPVLAETMRHYGYRSISQLAKAEKISATRICDLLNGKTSIYLIGGNYIIEARQIAEICGTTPEDVFPNQPSVFANFHIDFELPTLEEVIEKQDSANISSRFWDIAKQHLTDRQYQVLWDRIHLGKTLEETGGTRVSRFAIRDIELKAIRNIREAMLNDAEMKHYFAA